MPKTLANYRSLSRKAIDLSVGHQFSDHASWKKAIAQAGKYARQADSEQLLVINYEYPKGIQKFPP